MRSEITGPGIGRRRYGRGFRYLKPDGAPVTDAATLSRIKTLVIPPAWEDVWICPDPDGHIQAVGSDAAGRRQYRYHDRWRELRDREKFDRVLEFGRTLPKIRAVADRHLRGPATLSRERVLATAIRLIDLGFFRPGGDEYAAENGSYGLATIRREHVTCSRNGEISFDYIGKSGKQQEHAVVDSGVFSVVRSLKLRRSRPDLEDLLVYRSGKRWHNVTAGDINDYLREISGDDYTAKDFRTWHATVLAAVGLAVSVQASRVAGRPQARHRPGRQGGGQLPRQHPGRSPRLLHRPAGHRAVRERRHDHLRPPRPRQGPGIRRRRHPRPRRTRRPRPAPDQYPVSTASIDDIGTNITLFLLLSALWRNFCS